MKQTAFITAPLIMSEIYPTCMFAFKKKIVTRDFTFTEVVISPLFFTGLSCIQVILALLGAGAAHIQNDVLLGIDSDKISAFECQMTSWGVDNRQQSNVSNYNINISALNQSSCLVKYSCRVISE